MTPLMIELKAELKGLIITSTIQLAIRMVMLIRRRRMNVFPQRLLTSLLLLARLSRAPIRSTIITGTTKENMTPSMTPGSMKQINPSAINMPVMIPAASKDGSLDIVKLKLSRMRASPLSRMSEAHLMITPSAIVLTIQLKMNVKARAAIRAAKKL